MEEPIRVMITDYNEVVREGLKSIFEAQKDILVVGQAVDGQDAVEKAGKLQPDVILMDGQMPRMDGPTAIRAIKKIMPDVKILFLTVYGDYAGDALAAARDRRRRAHGAHQRQQGRTAVPHAGRKPAVLPGAGRARRSRARTTRRSSPPA